MEGIHRGTAVYAGIGESDERIARHIAQAAEAGLCSLFTSVQLPEADPRELLRQLPLITREAHRGGLEVDADVGARTAALFGIDLMDLASFRSLGIDVIRLDYGYTPRQIAELSHNKQGLGIELNACSPEVYPELERFGVNKSNVRCCHNYYPMRYTGLDWQEAKKDNETAHSFGYCVGGFIASQAHRHRACREGLPTCERHRDRNTASVAQEMMLLGFDSIFFGDDFASMDEMASLAQSRKGPVIFRVEPVVDGRALRWALGRELHQMQRGLEAFVRSSFASAEDHLAGGDEDGLVCPRRAGDVTMNKAGYDRYAGEIQLVRKDLPADERVGLIARIVEDDRPILEVFREGQPFKLIRSPV